MIPQSISSKLTDFQVAELVVDGLAICCFNNEKVWEVAYPRQQQHILSIVIQKLDGAGKPIINGIKEHPVPGNVRSFTLSLTSGSRAHEAVFPRGGPAAANFVRTAPNNDPHDLGWLIDMAGPEPGHNFRRLRPRAVSQRDVTLARFPNSLLFTRRPGDDPTRLSPEDNDDPLGPGSREIGHTNEAVGGVLLAAGNGEIRFQSEPAGSLKIGPLPYDKDRRYKIRIINEDSQDGVRRGRFIKGDFHFFYDIIDVDGVKQELWAIPKPTALGSTSNGDCNPVGASVSTLRDLL